MSLSRKRQGTLLAMAARWGAVLVYPVRSRGSERMIVAIDVPTITRRFAQCGLRHGQCRRAG